MMIDDIDEDTDATLLLLNEAISMMRKEGVAGQHLSAVCDARDLIIRLTEDRIHAILSTIE